VNTTTPWIELALLRDRLSIGFEKQARLADWLLGLIPQAMAVRLDDGLLQVARRSTTMLGDDLAPREWFQHQILVHGGSLHVLSMEGPQFRKAYPEQAALPDLLQELCTNHARWLKKRPSGADQMWSRRHATSRHPKLISMLVAPLSTDGHSSDEEIDAWYAGPTQVPLQQSSPTESAAPDEDQLFTACEGPLLCTPLPPAESGSAAQALSGMGRHRLRLDELASAAPPSELMTQHPCSEPH